MCPIKSNEVNSSLQYTCISVAIVLHRICSSFLLVFGAFFVRGWAFLYLYMLNGKTNSCALAADVCATNIGWLHKYGQLF